MANKTNRRALLTSYQARVFREYERILEITGLNPDRIFDFAEEDPESVVPILKSMTDQAVRSDVIYDYTMIDMALDFLIYHHFFGSGKRLNLASRTKRYKTMTLMLQNNYLMQKLTIIRIFKKVPKPIVSKIAAINDLRNGLAHTFIISDLKKSKRTYKGYSILTRSGLGAFRKDVQEVRYFFMPWLKKIFGDNDN